MKNIIISFCLICASFSGYSQTIVKQDANGNYIATKAAIVADKATGKTFTDSKGIKYPVYLSKNGKLYIIRTTKESGKKYKQYLKIG